MRLPTWRPAPRTLLTVGLALLLLIVIVGGAWLWSSAQEERAQSVHAEALGRVAAVRGAQDTAAAAEAMRALEGALAQAPSAALAAQSAYELGNLRFDAGAYPAARAAYEIAVAKATSATVKTLARAGVAATWEAQREYAKSVDAYAAAVAAEKPGAFYYEDLLLGLGRAQELAGRREDAIQTYRRLLKDVPKLQRESEVRGRLASLSSG